MFVPNLSSLVLDQTPNSGIHKDLAEQPEFDPAKSTGLTAERRVKRVEGIAKVYGWSHALLLTRAISKTKRAVN